MRTYGAEVQILQHMILITYLLIYNDASSLGAVFALLQHNITGLVKSLVYNI